ncbi:Fe-S cluster assembly protein SufD [Corynebacterium cystitidis]|uniref:Fe-S cluster assembly protein SufD n=1 Tax=Corynebacterium cystitidis DSM 20524 TaxID=1121357 RepID=A0A1H9PJZ4_9CORY|nr:Fe-S cluster assembly protein SufD [Corynebacterium cystitidis]WJY82465.1 FeS cluster assembly protein SufD [Corynebacterium cystitidis DSM 20524]SER48561.1 Fe-S cluster assembly protein SufD [Corynebacterium cystitidis DSM 20524]SNV75408.1 ABC transporter [Corynebacterium cystitidis]
MADTVVQSGTPNQTKGDLFSSYNVEDFDVPGGRDEVWRFISLRRLRGLHNGDFAPAAKANVDVQATGNVKVETVAPSDERLQAAGGAVDRVAAQAWTSVEDATIVTVPANEAIDEPIVITITGAGESVTSFGAVLVQTETGSDATVVVQYQGSGTHADNVNFILGDNSRLDVVVDANWDEDALHLGQQNVVVGRDATLRHTVATFGGEIVRIVPRVKFTAPGGDAELLGVYFADDGQYIENRLLVDHAVPNCRSNVMYKGALQADKHSKLPEARTCWVGDVLIRANAQGTDTYEVNRNLVLTEGARADSIPNLEIETGEIVGAGHAATVGRFDDEQVFYLRSRGIPEDQARRLIIRGFFDEVIRQVPVESIREALSERVEDELGRINL